MSSGALQPLKHCFLNNACVVQTLVRPTREVPCKVCKFQLVLGSMWDHVWAHVS